MAGGYLLSHGVEGLSQLAYLVVSFQPRTGGEIGLRQSPRRLDQAPYRLDDQPPYQQVSQGDSAQDDRRGDHAHPPLDAGQDRVGDARIEHQADRTDHLTTTVRRRHDDRPGKRQYLLVRLRDAGNRNGQSDQTRPDRWVLVTTGRGYHPALPVQQGNVANVVVLDEVARQPLERHAVAAAQVVLGGQPQRLPHPKGMAVVAVTQPVLGRHEIEPSPRHSHGQHHEREDENGLYLKTNPQLPAVGFATHAHHSQTLSDP